MVEIATKVENSELRRLYFISACGLVYTIISSLYSNYLAYMGMACGMVLTLAPLISHYARFRQLKIDSEQIKLLRKSPFKDLAVNWSDVDAIKQGEEGVWIFYKKNGLPSSAELRATHYQEDKWSIILDSIAKHDPIARGNTG